MPTATGQKNTKEAASSKRVRHPEGSQAHKDSNDRGARSNEKPQASASRRAVQSDSTIPPSRKRTHSQRSIDSGDDEPQRNPDARRQPDPATDPPSDEGGDNEDDIASAAARQLAGKPLEEHPWYTIGKGFGRTIDMFMPFVSIITAGQLATHALPKSVDDDEDTSESEDEEDEEEAERQECKRLLELLKKEIPDLSERILVGETAQIANELRVSRNNARSTDLNSIKTRIISDFLKIQDLESNDKSKRGRFNKTTARLLAPADADYDNDESIRESILSGEYEYDGANDWPLFLYADFKADPKALSNRVFESELLFQVWRCIFFGPSKANPRDGANRPSRRSNATLHNMTRTIKPASIAYVATLIRHSLSSEDEFHPEGHAQGYDYRGFYESMRDFLEGRVEGSEEKAKEIVDIWNRTMFPKTAAKRSVKKDGGVKGKMLQQLKKRKALEEAN